MCSKIREKTIKNVQKRAGTLKTHKTHKTGNTRRPQAALDGEASHREKYRGDAKRFYVVWRELSTRLMVIGVRGVNP
jgi:hypothetical protein